MAASNSASHTLTLIAVCFCISVHESSHLVSSENPFCVSDRQGVMKMSFPTFPTVTLSSFAINCVRNLSRCFVKRSACPC